MATAVTAPALDAQIADRLWEAAPVVDDLIKAPDADVPKELLRRAECVVVLPGLKKAAFGFGGQLGRGAVSCRKAGKGPFGPPSMISLTGGSFGFQIGGQETDVVMLFMTPESFKYLLRDKVTLGADASAAGGPKGRTASAETSASMRAEILTYSRSRGAFAGVSLTGSVLRPDKDANENLYGRNIDAKEIVQQGNVAIPEAALKFVDAVSRAAGTK
jgi:lipid-binding SYLF domain-containing protein